MNTKCVDILHVSGHGTVQLGYVILPHLVMISNARCLALEYDQSITCIIFNDLVGVMVGVGACYAWTDKYSCKLRIQAQPCKAQGIHLDPHRCCV